MFIYDKKKTLETSQKLVLYEVRTCGDSEKESFILSLMTICSFMSKLYLFLLVC